MKKFILTVVATMVMTAGFAGTQDHRAVRDAERYDMSFDVRRLAVKLGLNCDQMEAISEIQENFNAEMQAAAYARGHQRRALVEQAVDKDVRQVRYVLNDKQYDTYLLLLGLTLQNKGF